jgi:hypothetical protein
MPTPDRATAIEEDMRIVKATVGALQVEMAELGTGIEHQVKYMERELSLNTEAISRGETARDVISSRIQSEMRTLNDRIQNVHDTATTRAATLEKALGDRLTELEQAPAREAAAEALRRRAADENRVLALKNGAMTKVIEVVVGFALMGAGVAMKAMWDSSHPASPPPVLVPQPTKVLPEPHKQIAPQSNPRPEKTA